MGIKSGSMLKEFKGHHGVITDMALFQN